MENNIKEAKPLTTVENTKTYDLALMNEEYELVMKLNESFIEFKLSPKNTVSTYYYQERFDLKTLIELLVAYFKELKEVFKFYDKILTVKKVKLVKNKEKDTISLNYKTIIHYDEEVETNLELKKIIAIKDDIKEDLIQILFKEVNKLKKKLNIKESKGTLNKDVIPADNKDIQKLITNKLNELQKEEEKKYNDMKEEYEKKIYKQNIIINEIKNELKEVKQKQNELSLKIKETTNYYEEKIKQLKQEPKLNELKKEPSDNNNEFKKLEDNKLNEFKEEKENNNNINAIKSSQEDVLNKIGKEYELKIN